MTALEICILVGAIALVVFTVAFNVVRKLRGKSGCGCDCGAGKKVKGGCGGDCAHCCGCAVYAKNSGAKHNTK